MTHQSLDTLLDRLVDSLEELSEDELLAEYRADGLDPAKEIARLKVLLNTQRQVVPLFSK